MDELLNKLKEPTDEEKKQVQQFWTNKKPSVPFSKATLNDCVRPDGLALNIDYATIDAPSRTFRLHFLLQLRAISCARTSAESRPCGYWTTKKPAEL